LLNRVEAQKLINNIFARQSSASIAELLSIQRRGRRCVWL